MIVGERREMWLRLATEATGGASGDRLSYPTGEGFELPALATPDTAAPVFVPRGQRADGRSWDLRTRIDTADPCAAIADILDDISGGASSVLLDLMGPQRIRGVKGPDDLRQVLDGVALRETPVALDAGLSGLEAADWLVAAARGAPLAELAFHFDPLGSMAEARSAPAGSGDLLGEWAQAALRHLETHPRSTLFLASGRAIHESGARRSQELGFVAASGLAYAEALTEAGLSWDEAFSRIVLGLSVDADMFGSVAKLRAARLIWARLTEVCGARAPARIEARSSRRLLSPDDIWRSLLRLATATFAGAVGGADAIIIEPPPTANEGAEVPARRHIRGIQLVLMEEAGLGGVADPASGSWFLDRYARELARSGWRVFQAIERAGGAEAAIRSGAVADLAMRGGAE
ncbi:MAG: hypothetical protein JOZ42_09885 [Acetobacteraceae bacterium]|nr:hypothetical protein [Acetobacteraceae bacterium]